MPTDSDRRPRGHTATSLGLVLPILVLLSLVVVIVPVSPVILDFLLAANITTAIVLLLSTLFITRPLDFSAFPSILLLTTLSRLVLNVASTRLVLTRAATHGTSAAGEVIHAFARFVAQDDLAVGFVLFAILVVIQFVVVTRGATRLSEVAARFTLDGMPGRQLAVDAELNAGTITADEARRRRAEIAAQADFHAAMDGAGKFVRGDAVAGILITFVNLIGGMAIGMIQYHMPAARAAEVFALLTIGDGLVTQIPSFLIGLSAALLATRSSSESNLSQTVIRQTVHEPAVLYLASAVTLGLVFTGLPALPLLLLSAGCAVAGERQRRRLKEESEAVRIAAAPAKEPAKPATRPEDRLAIEPIELQLGVRLIRLANDETGGLLDRVTQLRHRVAQELGILLPKVKFRDNLRLSEREYHIKLRGVTIASGSVQPDRLLALDTGSIQGELTGHESIEPVSGKPGKWIDPALAEQARELGYQLIEPAQLIIAHLAEVVRTHADELLTRQQVHQLLDNLRQTSPRVVDELIPHILKPAQVHQVLGNLLQERVPVRDLETILEALGDHADETRDPALLTEYVRQALGRTVCLPYRDARGTIHALTLDLGLEDLIASAFDSSPKGPASRLTPQMTEGLCRELARQAKKLIREGLAPVVVCGPQTRRLLRQLTAGTVPQIAILGLGEIPRDTTVRSIAQIPLAAVKVPMAAEMRTRPVERMRDSVAVAIS